MHMYTYIHINTSTTPMGSKNTGFVLRLFASDENKGVFVLSMICCSKTSTRMLLVTFKARLTRSRHMCCFMSHSFGCLSAPWTFVSKVSAKAVQLQSNTYVEPPNPVSRSLRPQIRMMENL